MLIQEDDMRALLAAATRDQPAGIDLLAKVRRTAPARRRLVPALATLGTAAVIGAAAIVVSSLSPAPSAQAQVVAAAERTSGQPFKVHVVSAQGGNRMSFDGAFDPARRVGKLWKRGERETRYVGDTVYDKYDPTWRGGPPLPAGKQWISYSRLDVRPTMISPALELIKLAPQDPQTALQRLRSATNVRERGAASGPGWTGHRYSFSVEEPMKAGKDPRTAVGLRVAGTVDIDSHDRVRRLDFMIETDEVAKSGTVPMKPVGVNHVVMDFSAYGSRPKVTAPPADQVATFDQLVQRRPRKAGSKPTG